MTTESSSETYGPSEVRDLAEPSGSLKPAISVVRKDGQHAFARSTVGNGEQLEAVPVPHMPLGVVEVLKTRFNLPESPIDTLASSANKVVAGIEKCVASTGAAKGREDNSRCGSIPPLLTSRTEAGSAAAVYKTSAYVGSPLDANKTGKTTTQ